MYSVLVILAVVIAVLLILIVLIQESKGGGLASSFASSNLAFHMMYSTYKLNMQGDNIQH